MICATSRKTSFALLHQRCHCCAMRIRIVDTPHGNLYVYIEILIGCLSYILGFRTESDFTAMYEEATAHYGFNPDEVNKTLFDSHPDSKC